MGVTDPRVLLSRFTEDTGGTDECLEWPHGRFATGYGVYNIEGESHYVHRLVYEDANGPITKGHHVHHTCRNRLCFNPRHLQALSPEEHSRQHHLAKPECVNGHPYPQSLRSDGRGCKVCNRNSQRERSRRQRAPDRERWNERNDHARHLLAEGLSRKDVAEIVGASVETVRRIDLGHLKRDTIHDRRDSP